MTTPQYILSHYIIDNINLKTIEDVNKHLYQQHNIMTKEFIDLDMTIYYNKYDNKHKSPMELANRSVILSNSTHKVLCYTCPTPIYNMEAIQYLWRNQDKPRDTYICYEGSLISVFNYNNKWHVASRKNIYNLDSLDENDNKNQYKMFMEVLKEDNYNTLDDFTKSLNPELSYHFVLIHHKNDNIVNYVSQFGEHYKKLCFIFARKIDTQEELKSEDIECTFISENIFLPKLINENDTKNFVSKLSDINVTGQTEYEGIVIKINGNILKLQSSAYQFHKAIGSDKNMFRGFISLYQNNSLKNFFAHDNNDKFKKIVNPMNTTESFDTVGMIDALFKVVTSELYNLFYILWNDKGDRLNTELYTLLPREYKDIIFHLRGVFFTLKAKFGQLDEPILKLKDVYNFIKTIDISMFEKFIRCRKLMLNWARIEKSNNVNSFVKSLHKCEKVYYKLSAIYTTKLFPEIMPDDLPAFGQ